MREYGEQISPSQTSELREKGLLQENEVAFLTGDLVVAENVETKVRRVLGKMGILSESVKRLLKG